MSPFRRIFRSFTTLPWAQFGALAFLLLLLGLFFLLFLFLKQLILSLITAIFLYSMSSIGLVKVVLMRRDRSRWQLPPDSLSECFTSFTDLHAPENFVESAELWRRFRVWPARPAGGPRHLLPLLVMGIILILELKPRGDLMGLRHANLVSVKKACKERKMQRITKDSFASAQTPHNASSFTSHQKPTS